MGQDKEALVGGFFFTRGSMAILRVADLVLQLAKTMTGSLFGCLTAMDLNNGTRMGPLASDMPMGMFSLTEEWMKSHSRKMKSRFRNQGLEGVLNRRDAFYTNWPGHDQPVDPGERIVTLKRFLYVPLIHEPGLMIQAGLADSNRDYEDEDLTIVESLVAFYALAIHREMSGQPES